MSGSTQKHRGKNIKLFDKIKLQHYQTKCMIHTLNNQLKNSSSNIGVGCHKFKDQTDWFVVLRIEIQQNTADNVSYHFQYGDKLILQNIYQSKYLVTTDFPSEISRNYQVSLSQKGHGLQQAQWQVISSKSSQDSYWRVGQRIKIKNIKYDNYLCSHNKKLKQSADNQVYVSSKDHQDNKKSNCQTNQEQQQWVVTQLQPFIYTANLTDKKPQKKSEQAQQYQNLKKLKTQLQQPKKQINPNITQQLLKIGNQRLVQIQKQKKKQQQFYQSLPFYKKIFYYSFCCKQNDRYYQFD